ncbi:hypothetical protein [Phormidium sp. CCY1219]|uniref:hypothetical protein n=1 Tax=Phormidium sp. CCY1219 TaxID=2886104 RepID=UPI002D1F6DC4|nr:hypothetical protein [Phormidium sp. CCY1219]MEB3831886.1 hypothetical protein [Phormidium sp. CCY1219]
MKILSYQSAAIAAVGITAAGITAIAPIAAAQNRCGWLVTVYNDNEPDNTMQFEGVRIDGRCVADTLRFNGRWNDGPMSASIYPAPNGQHFVWRVDEKTGTAENFYRAYQYHMPALLTDPDDAERHDDW